MFLAIDVGNTQTVLGCFLHSKLIQQWRVRTQPVLTADEYRIKIQSLFRAEDLDETQVESVIVSSVVPQVTGVFRSLFSSRAAFHLVSAQTPFRFGLKRVAASEVGADRLVNAEAAVREYGTPVVILDSGTATTLCAVSPEGEFLGGAIMPGIEGSIQTLVRSTAQLNPVELELPPAAIGRDTKEAIQSGILYGYASMVDGMVARFKEELEREYGAKAVRVVATGGVSARLGGIARSVTDFDPDLTLKGLAYLHETLLNR